MQGSPNTVTVNVTPMHLLVSWDENPVALAIQQTLPQVEEVCIGADNVEWRHDDAWWHYPLPRDVVEAAMSDNPGPFSFVMDKRKAVRI